MMPLDADNGARFGDLLGAQRSPSSSAQLSGWWARSLLRRAFEAMEARPAKWLARSMQQNRALVAAGAGSTWRRADRVVRVAGLVVVGKVVMVMETVGMKKRVKENGSRKTGQERWMK